MTHYLFVCKLNISRSPWAAEWFEDYCKRHGIPTDIKSAGIDLFKYDPAYRKTHTQLTPQLVQWAHRICVMEHSMTSRIQQSYGLPPEKIVCLDIPDGFRKNIIDEVPETITPAQAREWLEHNSWSRFGPRIFAKLLESRLEDIILQLR